MKLTDIKIGKRLGLGFGVILLMVIGVGVTGYWGINTISDAEINMLKGDATVSEHASRARANVLGLRRFEKDIYINIGSKEKVAEYVQKWKEQYEHLTARLNDAEKAATLQQDKEKIQTMKTELANYESGFMKVLGSLQAGKIKTTQAANAAITEYKDQIHKLENAAKDLADETSKRMDAQEGLVKSRTKFTNMVMISLSLAAIALCLFIVAVMTRSIVVPVNAINEVAGS